MEKAERVNLSGHPHAQHDGSDHDPVAAEVDEEFGGRADLAVVGGVCAAVGGGAVRQGAVDEGRDGAVSEIHGPDVGRIHRLAGAVEDDLVEERAVVDGVTAADLVLLAEAGDVACMISTAVVPVIWSAVGVCEDGAIQPDAREEGDGADAERVGGDSSGWRVLACCVRYDGAACVSVPVRLGRARPIPRATARHRRRRV